MIGWIKINRCLMSHWIGQDPQALAVWIRMLSEANFEDKTTIINGVPVRLKRGELVFGLNAFSKKSGVSINTLRRILTHMETDSVINRLKTNKYSIISIVNYDYWQESTDKPTVKPTDKPTDKPTTPKEVRKKKEEIKQIPYQLIVDAYHECCTNLPQVQLLTDKRKAAIKRFWNHSEKHQDIEFIKRYLNHVNSLDFLIGNVDAKDRNKPWKADLEWLMKIDNLAKVVEGKYNND